MSKSYDKRSQVRLTPENDLALKAHRETLAAKPSIPVLANAAIQHGLPILKKKNAN